MDNAIGRKKTILAISVITATLAAASIGTTFTIQPASAFCNGSSCVEVGPSGSLVTNPNSLAGTQVTTTNQPGAAILGGGASVAAGSVLCGGNPAVATPNTGLLCPP